MDSYLEIARKVLSEARRPLNARHILKIAYRMQAVPADLFGRTQHKTLQARLSTDILQRKGKSDFYRTGPGMFSLRNLRMDRGSLLPHAWEYAAPPRAAQLGRFEVLAFARSNLCALLPAKDHRLRAYDLCRSPSVYPRLKDLTRHGDVVALRVIVLLLHEDSLLLRQRRPVDVGSMPSRTALGFEGVVRRDDRQLFSEDDFGLIEAASRTVAGWLSLPPAVLPRLRPLTSHREAPILFEEEDQPAADDLIVLLAFDCADAPEVIEATRDRARFDWQVLPVGANDLDRFDRWSARLVADWSLQALALGRS